MVRKVVFGIAAVLTLLSGTARAHHSFAAFFDPDKIVKVRGTVASFRFTNPHGTIVLDVLTENGETREWRVETNAPVVLVRAGWSTSTLKPGDLVTIEGWLARSGKPYLRLRQAFDAKGNRIGDAPFGIMR